MTGARVVILAGRMTGRSGTVAAEWRERGCGCLSVIVKIDGGHDWVGKASEVRSAAASVMAPVTPEQAKGSPDGARGTAAPRQSTPSGIA